MPFPLSEPLRGASTPSSSICQSGSAASPGPSARAGSKRGSTEPWSIPARQWSAALKVTITNNSTGVVTDAVTSTAGTFNAVSLLPGEYSVVVDAAGFRKSQTSVLVEIAKMSSITVTLQPGAASETVSVKWQRRFSLDTTSPEIGTTLEPELVDAAPIEISGLSRQIDSFSYLAPGVQGNAGSHAINGGVTFENEVQFNGVPVAFIQFQGNQTNINPPYEAVNEFRVNTSTFNAQYGLGQGAVTFSLASGTNSLHGDGFDIIRNQLFDSAGFFPTRFSPSGKAEPPVNQQNDYGFSVGGPVWLPHVYNGRNRTFFHVSLDWFRQNQALNNIGTVPTAAMKGGDFSNWRCGYRSQYRQPGRDPDLRSNDGTAVPQQQDSANALQRAGAVVAGDHSRSGHRGGEFRTDQQQAAGDSLHPHPPEALGLHHRRKPLQHAEHPFQPVAGQPELPAVHVGPDCAGFEPAAERIHQSESRNRDGAQLLQARFPKDWS